MNIYMIDGKLEIKTPEEYEAVKRLLVQLADAAQKYEKDNEDKHEEYLRNPKDDRDGELNMNNELNNTVKQIIDDSVCAALHRKWCDQHLTMVDCVFKKLDKILPVEDHTEDDNRKAIKGLTAKGWKLVNARNHQEYKTMPKSFAWVSLCKDDMKINLFGNGDVWDVQLKEGDYSTLKLPAYGAGQTEDVCKTISEVIEVVKSYQKEFDEKCDIALKKAQDLSEALNKAFDGVAEVSLGFSDDIRCGIELLFSHEKDANLFGRGSDPITIYGGIELLDTPVQEIVAEINRLEDARNILRNVDKPWINRYQVYVSVDKTNYCKQ